MDSIAQYLLEALSRQYPESTSWKAREPSKTSEWQSLHTEIGANDLAIVRFEATNGKAFSIRKFRSRELAQRDAGQNEQIRK